MLFLEVQENLVVHVCWVAAEFSEGGRWAFGTGSCLEGVEKSVHLGGVGEVGCSVGEGDGRPVVQFEYVVVDVWVVKPELSEKSGVGTSPCVNVLVGIGGDGDGLRWAQHELDHAVLDGSEVLEFVYQEVPGAYSRPGLT